MIGCTFALAFAAVLPCADPEASGDRLPPSFHFASFERADDALAMRAELHDGLAPEGWQPRLVIDGHVTDAPWPGSYLSSWKVSEEIFLLHDHYSGSDSLYLWNREDRALRDIGRGRPQTIANVGTIILRREPEEPAPADKVVSWSVSNFNPMTAQPRRLSTHEGEANAALALVGHRGDALVLRLGNDFITLTPGERPIVKQYELGDWRPAQSDAVRGSKMLLLGRFDRLVLGNGYKPYECDVALLDLDDGTIESIGMIRGSWTGHTAVPHPHVGVAWISREQIKQFGKGVGLIDMRFPLGGLGFGPTGYVREDTLRTWPPKKMGE